MDEFTSKGIKLLAVSSDTLKKAQESVRENKLTFPVGYGLDIVDTARTLGAFYENERRFLHAAGFILFPDSTVGSAVYSSSGIGRLRAEDCLRWIGDRVDLFA